MTGRGAPIRDRVVRFDTFEADFESGELRKNGLRIRLQEQPFAILKLLLSSRGEIVTRKELREKIWPENIYVDFQHGLNKAVSKLRLALSDRAAAPRYIETIPRRGYRFLPGSSGLNGSQANGARKRVRVLVLPFRSIGHRHQEPFSDGVMEEIITLLGKVDPQRLGIIAVASAEQYRHTRKTIAEIACEMDVDFVLEGSVCSSKQSVSMAARLVEAATETQLWADSFLRPQADPVELQRMLSECLVNSVKDCFFGASPLLGAGAAARLPDTGPSVDPREVPEPA